MKHVPLTKRMLTKFLTVHPDWQVNKRETQLHRTFALKDYVAGLIFIARIAVHAEINQHHPDITLSYGKVKVTLTTHELKALSELDTALAAKIDKLYEKA